MDYLVGGGGALVESMVYRTSAPLAYVPMYGSGQNPAGAIVTVEICWANIKISFQCAVLHQRRT